MNLATVERMAREGDLSKDALRYLLTCRGECEWLDYKESLSLSSEKDLCDFCRDVLALKNMGGGYILIGVQDKSWRPVGLSVPFPYDIKLLRDKIRKCLGLDLDVDVVTHQLAIDDENRGFALVLVRASRKRAKRRIPSMVLHDYCPTKPFGVRRGEIYVRKGDSTTRVSTEEELSDLLDALEAQADRDALEAGSFPSPFAVDHGTYRLLEPGYERFVGRAQLKEAVLRAVEQDPRIWILNVHGPGGVGKSAVVNWVTYEIYNTRRFEAILQLTGKETVLTDAGIRRYGRNLFSLESLLDNILLLFEEPLPDDLTEKKTLAVECLNAWKTLLVLDNMETVNDGRVLRFIQDLPPATKAKVILTSRQKTGGWELPIPVAELTRQEVEEFVRIKSEDLGIDFPLDAELIRRVADVTGGLPLAIQWVIGQYRMRRNLEDTLSAVRHKDSPILEFSFRNVWSTLAADAQAVLAALSVFDAPPTIPQITIATEFSIERIEVALRVLEDITLVTRRLQESDGQLLFVALPITLTFAANQLETMGDFETRCRQRLQVFTQQMELQESETHRFKSIFERYGMNSANERRAAIMCRRAESEVFAGNREYAEVLFKQAREMAPTSAYVLAMSASFELTRGKIGKALEHAEEACQRATNRVGALCYTILARVRDAQRDRKGRVEALRRALEYDPSDVVLRHQYGVALSRAGDPAEATEEFSKIIEIESRKATPSATLIMAYTTRVINLRRLGRSEEARADLELARSLVTNWPHLQDSGERIAELEE